MEKYLEEITGSLEDHDVILITAPSEELEEINTNIIEYVSGMENSRTVYVTVSKPYSTITNIFDKKGIDMENIFFIDGITKTASGVSEEDVSNCVFLNPKALTDISIALSQAIEGIDEEKERFLFVDSLGTLMMYNDDKAVGKFAHSLINKVREWGIKSVMLTLEEEAEEEVMSQVKQFCDKTISVNR